MQFVRAGKISREKMFQARVRFMIISVSAVIIFLVTVLLSSDVNLQYSACLWFKLTGTYCPGCGTIRGLQDMIHGNWLGLYKYNKLAFLALPFAVYFIGNTGFQAFAGRRLIAIKLATYELWIVYLLIILYTIFRNFVSFLAPM